MAGLAQVYEQGKTHYQIGDNNNLFDWTYVGNVAHAHLLAADRLVPPPDYDTPEALSEAQSEITSYPLTNVSLSTGGQRLPTSEARPLGPYVELPENGEQIEAAFNEPFDVRKTNRPVVRSRFDPLSDTSLARVAPENPLQVSGQAFFITNGEPVYFWDMPRLVWSMLAEHDKNAPPPRKIWKLSKDVGFAIASAGEWWGWLVGKEPALTRFRVTYSCAHRYHNIEKARRVLGYEPQVGLEEGVNKMIAVSTSSGSSRQ